jgi:hypothetical protein
MIRAIVFIVFTSLFAAAGPLLARDIYVSNTQGSNYFDGNQAVAYSNVTGPVKTITRALELARRGDRIIIQDTGQPYRESITLSGPRHSGTASLPFTISGNGAVLDGSVAVPTDTWEFYRGETFRFRPKRKTYLQLFFNSKPLVKRQIDANTDGPPDLKTLEWCMHRGWVYFCTEKGKLPDTYRLTQTGARVGITMYRVDHVVVDGLVVQAFQLDGINAHDQVRYAQLSGLTCRGNGRSGVSVGGASSARIMNSLIGNNGRSQVRLDYPAALDLVSNVILDNTAPSFVNNDGRLYVDGKAVIGGQ